MYKTSRVNPEDLGKIKVKNQSKIKEITGAELVPTIAWEIIKKESKDFTKDSPKAKQADALFAELMKANGLTVHRNTESSGKESDEEIKIKAQARKRALELLELELELAA